MNVFSIADTVNIDQNKNVYSVAESSSVPKLRDFCECACSRGTQWGVGRRGRRAQGGAGRRGAHASEILDFPNLFPIFEL